MKSLLCLLVFLIPSLALSQEYSCAFPEASTALAPAPSSSIQPPTNALSFELLPFLSEERKKLEAIIVKRDAEIIRLMNELSRVRIDLKECSVEYKSCRNSTIAQLVLGGLTTITGAYAGYNCHNRNPN